MLEVSEIEYIKLVEGILLHAKFERWGKNAWVRCCGPDQIDEGNGGTCYDTAWALDTMELYTEAERIREILPELVA
jgi:hypothetical protein